MGLTGIMLAGGDATRMPNKALLPILEPYAHYAIANGLRFLEEKKCTEIFIVTPKSDIIKTVIERTKTRMIPYHYVVQSGERSVLNALWNVAKIGIITKDVLITFCDNIYSYDECVPQNLTNIASVRDSLNSELDRYDASTSLWISRKHPDICRCPAFAGWLKLSASTLVNMSGHSTSLIDAMNACNISPWRCVYPWCDIGTYDSYMEYLIHGPINFNSGYRRNDIQA